MAYIERWCRNCRWRRSEGLCAHPERVAKHLARTDPLGVCPLHTISGIKETDMTRRHVLGGV